VEAAASVSSFGFGGTNGHVVLASPEQKAGAERVHVGEFEDRSI